MRFDLTEQEQKIYELLATTDLTVKQIADKMCISYTTAATHKMNVFQKMYFKRRSELVRHYYEDLLNETNRRRTY